MNFLSQYENLKDAMTNERINNYGWECNKILNYKPGEVKYVERFEELDKGCLIYVKNEKQPMRASLNSQRVLMVSMFKKIIVVFLKSFWGANGMTKKSIFHKLLMLLFLKTNYEVFKHWFYFFLLNNYMDWDRYNQPVREVYRILSDTPEERDIICSVLEYDMAYRYRFQDIVYELDKEAFMKSPRREVTRLLRLMIDREDAPAMKSKWKYFEILLWYLDINRKLKNKLRQIVRNIKLEEIKSSKEDIYWQNTYKDYNYRGLSYEQRLKSNN